MWTDKRTSYDRARQELIGWLTTVSAKGVPSTAPVWFLLEADDSITIYSKDPSVRVQNIRSNDRITLHLEGDGRGGAIVVLNGSAALVPDAPAANDHAGFVAKYRPLLDQYGWSPEWFAEHYPMPIRMTVSSVRGN
jgi:PPOX class probable F420-dependent enzyme